MVLRLASRAHNLNPMSCCQWTRNFKLKAHHPVLPPGLVLQVSCLSSSTTTSSNTSSSSSPLPTGPWHRDGPPGGGMWFVTVTRSSSARHSATASVSFLPAGPVMKLASIWLIPKLETPPDSESSLPPERCRPISLLEVLLKLTEHFRSAAYSGC